MVQTKMKPTLVNLKKNPVAVVTIMAGSDEVPEFRVEETEYDWFSTTEAASNYFDDMVAFTKEDIEENGGGITFAMAEITDTDKMTFGRIDIQPESSKNKKCLAAMQKDPQQFFVYPTKEEMKEAEEAAAAKETAKKVVKPRKSAAKKVTKIEEAPTKRVKPAKKAPAKAEADKAPAKKAPAKKAAAKVVPPSKKAAAPAKAETEEPQEQGDKTAALRKRLAAKKPTKQS